MFVFKGNGSKHKKKSSSFGPYFPHLSHETCFVGYILVITRSGDVEINRGPKRNSAQTFSICHWNLNSVCAYNFAKLSLFQT